MKNAAIIGKPQIISRKNSLGHCPCCEERTVVVKGITDLFTMVPEIKEIYDFDENYYVNSDELSVSSQTNVNWKCKRCSYKWSTSVISRIVVEKDGYTVKECPSCTGNVRVQSYGEEYPDLAERFVVELNGCTLYDISTYKDAEKKYYWNCELCGENFESDVPTIIRARTTSSKGCSYCFGRMVLRQNSFEQLYLELMDEYDFANNEIDPFTVTEHSNKYVKWICRNNKEHKWKLLSIIEQKGMVAVTYVEITILRLGLRI